MARLSVAAVLLLVAVPLCMYTCALLVGVELGRAVERMPDTLSLSLSVRGVLDHVKKELWEPKGQQGKDADGGERALRWVQADDVLASRRLGRPPMQLQPNHPRHGSSGVVDLEIISASPSANRLYSNHTSPSGAISVGPWGGHGGQPFYHLHGSSVRRLRSIVVYHSTAIHSLAYQYQAGDGATRIAGPWGRSYSFGNKAARARIELDADEHVTAVEGTTGRFGNVPGDVVTSLTFRTSAGRTYGPYGDTAAAAAAFSVPAADGACVVGFWGRAGWLVDAVGVYIKPSCSGGATRLFVERAYHADDQARMRQAMMREAMANQMRMAMTKANE
ncbi:hypothetical protein ACP4OV_014882 [Aristida adscensionis]